MAGAGAANAHRERAVPRTLVEVRTGPTGEGSRMIGWWFVVTVPAAGDAEEVVLAKWENGIHGLDWISALVAAGRAEQLGFNGYPNRYTARAGDVLPLLADGSVSDARPEVGFRPHTLHPDLIAACPADALLTVDAWDQS